MWICFISRRFFPAISGMSVYALNLLRELVRLGHDVTMNLAVPWRSAGHADLRGRAAASGSRRDDDRAGVAG